MAKTWTQPVCDRCFRHRYPYKSPTRVRPPQLERCCLCGVITGSSIYIRIDPDTVEHPRTVPDDLA